MKKKLVIIALVFALVVSLFTLPTFAEESAPTYSGGTGTETDPYLISTKADLIALAEFCQSNASGQMDRATREDGSACDCGLGGYHGYYFKLTSDIDMTGVDWDPFFFCGTLDGAGHTISNMTMYEAMSQSQDQDGYIDDQYESAFFLQLVNATVKDLYFENCSSKVSSDLNPATTRDIYAAIVAGTAIASSFENVSVVNCTVEQNGLPRNFSYAAGIVALTDSCHISDCSVQGGSISTGGDAVRCFVGGIVGGVCSEYADFLIPYGNPYNMKVGNGKPFGTYGCFVSADVTSTVPYSVGGIVGWTITNYTDDVYENCYVTGDVISSNGKAGGIIGEGDSVTTLKNCAVLSEKIDANGNADPFVGTDYSASDVTVIDCKVSDQTVITGGTVKNILNVTPSDVSEQDVQPESKPSNLKGTLADQTAGVTVDLYDGSTLVDSAVTDENGYYNFGKDLKPGTYTVKIDAVSVYDAYEAEVEIPYASNVTLDIERVILLADYSAVDEALAAAEALNKELYKDFSAVEAAVAAVVPGKITAEQDAVDAMAKAINDAILALELKPADYTEVNAALATAAGLKEEHYFDFSDVTAAVADVDTGKDITEQAEVDAMAKAINDAIAALDLKDADYTAVSAAVNNALRLVKEDYKDFSKVEAALAAVKTDKMADEQDEVDAMAKAINDAVAALVFNGADYTALNALLDKVEKLDKNHYYDYSMVEAALAKVDFTKSNREQPAVDYMIADIESALGFLVMKPADYTEVDKALAAVEKLDKSSYKDFSKVEAAVSAVETGKLADEQAAVDAMAKAINDAIAGLVSINPGTSDFVILGTLLLAVAAAVAGVCIAKKRRA